MANIQNKTQLVISFFNNLFPKFFSHEMTFGFVFADLVPLTLTYYSVRYWVHFNPW